MSSSHPPRRSRLLPTFASLVAVLAIGAIGCGPSPALRTRHVVRAPAAPPEPPRSPAADDLPIPATLALTNEGREAVQVLGRAAVFGGAAVGYGGTPVAEVRALRTLLREDRAADALAVVLEHGTLPAQLMALSGLYFADHASFEAHLSRYRAMPAAVRYRHDGCMANEELVAVRDLVTRPGAIQLEGPHDSFAGWAKRNPGVGRTIVMDIAGGGYPDHLRGR